MKYLKSFNERNEVSEGGAENYMVFGNLKTIKRMVDELLEMDEKQIDDMIKNGHDWAEDHISVSKENIEQVYNFLVNGEERDNIEIPETGSSYDKLNIPAVDEEE